MATFTYTFETDAASDTDWTFSSPTAGTDVQPENTAGRWCWHDGETTSVGVGPFHGETIEGTSAGYIYTEMSSQAAGDVWIMEWDNTLDAAANDYTVEFNWCARGTEASPIIEVQTNEDGAGWVTRLLTGDENNTGDEAIPATSAIDGDTPWYNKQVDLASLISNASTLLRIRIQADTDPPASAQFWHNDIGIDSITIQEDPIVHTADGSPSITPITAVGASFIWPRVYLNTTPVLGGATELVVTDANAAGTSITFDDAEGAPTGALFLGVENQATGLVGWIAVTVDIGETADGAPSITNITSAGTAELEHTSTGSPSITPITSAGTGEVIQPATGAPSISSITSSGNAINCTEVLAPDAIVLLTNLAGAVTDIDERVDTPDSNWLILD